MNMATEKKLIKEVSDEQSNERKSFENKMKQEYKLKKERWKREMAEVDTPKRQREAVLSQHKENFKEIDAAETQRMTRVQKEYLDKEVRKFRRRRLIKYHDLEQDLLREVRMTKIIFPLAKFNTAVLLSDYIDIKTALN